MTSLCRAKLNHLYVCAPKKYNLFIEIIRSLLKSSVTGATPKIAKRTMHILKNLNLTQLSESTLP